jgi:hypothetical protein
MSLIYKDILATPKKKAAPDMPGGESSAAPTHKFYTLSVDKIVSKPVDSP